MVCLSPTSFKTRARSIPAHAGVTIALTIPRAPPLATLEEAPLQQLTQVECVHETRNVNMTKESIDHGSLLAMPGKLKPIFVRLSKQTSQTVVEN